MIDKLTVLELLGAGFFGIACFWAPTVNSAASNRLFAWVAQLSLRLDPLRRDRWQWLTVIGTMVGLRIQHQLPSAIEFMVGLTFLILLAFPLRQIIRARR